VTWQAAAFTILAVGLAAGFAWYERTKPDARLVALVGTLAAFAALGRIAFAPIPNVKPTTDIVLIAGFALGGESRRPCVTAPSRANRICKCGRHHRHLLCLRGPRVGHCRCCNGPTA